MTILATGFWDWLGRIAAEPALLELLLILVLGLLLWLVGLRLSRLAAATRSKAALADYLLGVEQALAGDWQAARRRLERVIAADPDDPDARLVYGDVLRRLGEHAEAHKQHLILQRSFGVDSVPNELALAHNLVEVGRHADAAEAAARIVAAHPEHREALRLLFEAQLGAGLPEPAGETGQTLLRLLPDGDERRRVRERAGAAFALAAGVRARGGDLEAAKRLAARARALAEDATEVRLLDARLALAERGADAAAKLLLPSPDALLPVPVLDLLPVQGTRPAASPLVLQPYRCRACAAPLASATALCPHCRSRDATEPLEPRLFGTVESPALLMDQVDQNQAYAQRLVARALAGDAAAETELVEVGAAAIDAILESAARTGSEALAQRWLIRMGPEILPALFAACARAKEKRVLPMPAWLRRDERPGLVAAVVQAFGRDATRYVRDLIGHPDRDLQNLVIDFCIALGDQAEFARLVEEYAPHELLRRLAVAPSETLIPFLAGVEAGSFLAEALLLSPVFDREEELIAALARAVAPTTLVQVLIRRGAGRATVRALIDRLDDPAIAVPALQVLQAFGDAALEQMIGAFVDPDRSADARARLESAIVALGAQTVEPLCSAFGAHPAASDGDVQRLLARLGDVAVDPLVLAYQRGGLLERIGLPLGSRRSHRREMILRALIATGTDAARAALQRLRGRETDDSLKLRIEQGLLKLRDLRQEPPARGGTEGHEQVG